MFTNLSSASTTPTTFSFVTTTVGTTATTSNLFGSNANLFGPPATSEPSKLGQFNFSPPRTTAATSNLFRAPAWGNFQPVKQELKTEEKPSTESSNLPDKREFSSNPFLTAKLFSQAGLNVKREGASEPPISNSLANQRKERKGSAATLSPEEMSRATVLKMPLIPPQYNNSQFLHRHFRVFGNIVQVKCSPRMGVATVEFDNHVSAKTAKEQGAVFKPNTEAVKILWGRPLKRDRLSDASEEIAAHSATIGGLEDQKPVSIPGRSDSRPSLRRMVSVAASPSVRAAVKKRISTDKPARPPVKATVSGGPKLESSKKSQPFSNLPSETARSIVSELRALLGKHASTVYEKWEILDERDKIMRKARRQKTEVGHGNCPDMCPEKERYQREVRKQVSPYEGHGGMMDPVKAVKDYSRSAADQEEPLPHDMRPSSVLRITMDYLLLRIIKDEPPPDSELLNWFDFLWTRTRAIRKDLTQQEICDMDAVELFEQITRLHIYVGHWMSGFEASEFDQKMNTENLSKCLQSLHQLYEDLAKRGKECPNEPEFRSYQILLNLNDSNVLRQALNWPAWVRESGVVRFALRLCCAVQNSNFVQVFRLIRDNSTYLQACFSHRYFHQMRKTALLIMVRAYGMNQEFPIETLCDWLGFESSAECLTFVNHYNLTASEQDGAYVLLNKTTFAEPESGTSLSVQRSFRLIESKRTGSLAELIRGSQVPHHDIYHPIDSFDANGNYTNDPVVHAYLEKLHDEFAAQEESDRVHRQQLEQQKLAERAAEIEAEKALWQQKLEEKERQKAQLEEQQRKQQMELNQQKIILPIMAKIIEEVTQKEETTKIVVECLSASLADRFAASFVDEFIRDIASQIHQDTKTKLDAIKECSLKNFYTILYEIGDREVEEICRNELRKAKKERIENLSTKVIDEIVESFLEGSVQSITRKVFQTDVVERLAQLELMKKRHENKRILAIYQRWKSHARKSAKRKAILAGFPISPHSGGASACADQLGLKRRRVSDPFALRSQLAYLNSQNAKMYQIHQQAWQPLDLRKILNEIEKLRRIEISGLRNIAVFKLLLICLNVEESGGETSRWLNAKFQLNQDLVMKKTYQYDYRTQHIVEVKCIRMNSKVQFRQELTGELQKSDACLIVCEGNCHSCFKLDMAEQSFLHCGKLLPVGTLMPEHHQECQLELALTNLHEEKLLDYKFSGSLEDNCSALQNTKTLTDIVTSLAKSSDSSDYMSFSLGDWINECFMAYVCYPTSQQLESQTGLSPEVSETIWCYLTDLISKMLKFLKFHSLDASDFWESLLRDGKMQFASKAESLKFAQEIQERIGNAKNEALKLNSFADLVDLIYQSFNHSLRHKFVIVERHDFEMFQTELESELLTFGNCTILESTIDPDSSVTTADQSVVSTKSLVIEEALTSDPAISSLLSDVQREISNEKLRLEEDQRYWAELLQEDFSV